MKKERKTYRMLSTGKAYLKYGLDAKWRKMERYDVIEEAVEKLAQYEDMEESVDNKLFIFRDTEEKPDNSQLKMYMDRYQILLDMIDDLRISVLGADYIPEGYGCDILLGKRNIIDAVINHYKKCNEERLFYMVENIDLQDKMLGLKPAKPSEKEHILDKIKRWFSKIGEKCVYIFKILFKEKVED